MALADFCKEEAFAWRNHYAKAYHAHVDADTERTVIRYQIPFPPDEEKIFMERFGLSANKRKDFYFNLLGCIQHQINVAKLLAEAEVPSVLRIYKVEQQRDADSITNIYLETDQIWPIRERLLSESVTRIDAINIVARLSIILRDIGKAPNSIVMRGFDINEVYVNSEQRIVLGGFFYASARGLDKYPQYMPARPNNLKEDLLTGAPGDSGSDMYSLACFAWNLFSATPLDAKIPPYMDIYPRYATDELVKALWLGRTGGADDVVTFRKRIADCRKQLAKEESETVLIPIRTQRRKKYTIEVV